MSRLDGIRARAEAYPYGSIIGEDYTYLLGLVDRAKIRVDLPCECTDAYKDRGLTDPGCFGCNVRELFYGWLPDVEEGDA